MTRAVASNVPLIYGKTNAAEVTVWEVLPIGINGKDVHTDDGEFTEEEEEEANPPVGGERVEKLEL